MWGVLAEDGEGVLKDVFSTYSEEDLLGVGELSGFLLLQHVSEDFGAHMEVINPWAVSQSDGAEERSDLVERNISRLV